METNPQEKWCLSLGNWSGITVRVHVFFPIFVALAFVYGESITHGGDTNYETMFLGLGVLIFSVLVHEFGHLIAARHVGQAIDSIDLFPWGANHDLFVASLPKRLVFLIAGPCANLFVCCASGVALLAFSDSAVQWSSLMNPLAPLAVFGEVSGQAILGMLFWVNWLLFLANLLPSMPFDGGHIVRVLTRILWKSANAFQVNYISATVALVTSVSFLLLAWHERDKTTLNNDPNTLWMALFMLGIVLLFSMRQFPLDDPEDEPIGLEVDTLDEIAGRPGFEGDLTWEDDELDYEDDETLSQWLRERKVERDRLRRDSEKDDEQKVDAILAEVHKSGIENLSDADRQLLQRVSARYRSRQNEQA